jgi:hypothetical protein
MTADAKTKRDSGLPGEPQASRSWENDREAVFLALAGLADQGREVEHELRGVSDRLRRLDDLVRLVVTTRG